MYHLKGFSMNVDDMNELVRRVGPKKVMDMLYDENPLVKRLKKQGKIKPLTLWQKFKLKLGL